MWIHKNGWVELGLFVMGPAANVVVIRDVIIQGQFGLTGLVKIVFKNICNGSVACPIASGCATAGRLDPIRRILFGQSQNYLGLFVANLRVVVLGDQPANISLRMRAYAPSPNGKRVGVPVVIGLMS